MAQQRKELDIAFAFTLPLQNRLLKLHIMMPIGAVQIRIFKGGGCRKHNVGIHRRIGHKQIMHHRKQILAGKPRLYLVGTRRYNQRIGAVDE
ncbi:hypothetical protein D3C80_1821860 [compost metagenome]